MAAKVIKDTLKTIVGKNADNLFLAMQEFGCMDTEASKKRLGDKLRKLREDRDLSLRSLAALADTEYSQIHRIELGQISPTAITLENLAIALNVKPCAFFDC